MNDEIDKVVQSTSFAIPSNYSDIQLNLLYGDSFANEVSDVFGCPSGPDGQIVDCKEAMTFYRVASMVCQARHALDVLLPTSRKFGPVYPVQWEFPNCDVVNGSPTKTCHCAEQEWVWSIKDPAILPSDQREEAQRLQDAYGQFFRDGTFPEGTFINYRSLETGKTNVIGTEDGLVADERFYRECQLLDKIDDYRLERWAFRTQL